MSANSRIATMLPRAMARDVLATSGDSAATIAVALGAPVSLESKELSVWFKVMASVEKLFEKKFVALADGFAVAVLSGCCVEPLKLTVESDIPLQDANSPDKIPPKKEASTQC